mgnify:CR=1 FL=1
MWKNYLVTALRELHKSALHALIGISCLAVGLATCLLILAHIDYELGYDTWAPAAERIYSFTARAEIQRSPEQLIIYGSSPYAAAIIFPEQVPGIEAGALLAQDDRRILEDGQAADLKVVSVTSSFFDFFPLPVISGSLKDAAATPSDIIMTRRTAMRLFGGTDIIDQSLETAGGDIFRVGAVVEDVPDQTHFNADIFLPYAPPPDSSAWKQSGTQQVYLELSPDADTEQIQVALEGILQDNLSPPDFGGASLSKDYTALLCPLSDLHFRRGLCNMLGKPPEDRDRLLAFGIIGGAILVLGIINFSNIAASRSLGRMREIALRKVVGATRIQIAGQFFAESVAIALMALMAGLLLAQLAQPAYATLIGRAETFSLLEASDPLFGLLLLTLIAGVAGGIYPTLLGLRIRPVIASNSTRNGNKPWLQTLLLGAQFIAGVTLGVGALVVNAQFLHLQSMDTGFDPRNVVVIDGVHEDGAAIRALLPALEQEASIDSAALTSGGPGLSGMQFILFSGDAAGDPEPMEILSVTPGYFDAFRIDVRFASGMPDWRMRWREGGVIVNETAARRLGFPAPEAALGAYLYSPDGDEKRSLEIIGVVNDMYMHSIQSQPQPAVFQPAPTGGRIRHLIVRITEGRTEDALATIDSLWAEAEPVMPVRRAFLADLLAARYFDELRRIRLAIALATAVAIAIAVLGLFGLASLIAQRRLHEVAIRKILGATTPMILRHMLWQFLWPVLAACMLGGVAAYLLLGDWLKGFAVRIDLTPWPFLLAGLAALGIALVTVAGHALNVARTHPALALREE